MHRVQMCEDLRGDLERGGVANLRLEEDFQADDVEEDVVCA